MQLHICFALLFWRCTDRGTMLAAAEAGVKLQPDSGNELLSYQQLADGGGLILFLLHPKMSSSCWQIEHCMLVLVSTNTSASVYVSDVHMYVCVCVALPLLLPVIHKSQYICFCHEATMKSGKQGHTQMTHLRRTKEGRKQKIFLTHSPASSPPPPPPAGVSSPASVLQAVADVAMATAEGWQSVEGAVMSQPPSWSPDSLTGASAEISALQLVERGREGGTRGERDGWREERERKGKDELRKGRNGRSRVKGWYKEGQTWGRGRKWRKWGEEG